MSFLLNAWYVAAFSDELNGATPLARTLLDRPVVLYRDSEGAAHALDDRCAHRFAPLSRGRVVGGVLECPYHGLRFDGAGRCVHNPHGDGRVPAQAHVRAYPVVERFGAVWFWPGEAARADIALLPAFDFVDPAQNHTHHGYLKTRAHYQLSADNLLDLSHFQFLHPDTLGSEAIASGDVQSGSLGETVWVRRAVFGEILQPFVADGFGIAAGTCVDRWMDVKWTPPGLLTIVVGVTGAGQPREAGRIAPSAHWLTPETACTTHYFFAFGLPKAMGDEGRALVRYAVEGLMKPFELEDLPMLEAQQACIGEADFWAAQPALLPIDRGAIRARRIMESMIVAERAGHDPRDANHHDRARTIAIRSSFEVA
ncbi:vanillate O-demethylase monooxygenase subunit [Paraburkholderia tropica]|uniref:aromatic ring-hydroxylating dioxygenase subunit alpha n=1 Tax=Paraburkholderia tropica TaxID=92647 RepID=UPI00161B5630|nr:aromatic ring-hydroxylating dioxygenase subunit alpha [Paraburkholderia tropica]MBB3000388.1 vanillate O-demethylase monooxygenase subunit [Paraburkholderia tropica]MBB6320017.1 vanillate O-demethylase monooxygenase subunit [Paraburkholderia tropica]